MISWAVLVGAIYLCLGVSWWFYPLAAFVIANRLLAISLLAHEALHYNLLPSRRWNDFVGRYFCAFPTAISLSRYRALHQMHHGGLGSERWDPDLRLFDFYPVTKWNLLRTVIFKTLSGQTAFAFSAYYTEFRVRGKDSDFTAFLVFWGLAFAVTLSFGWFFEYLVFYAVPFLFITQPYVLLMAGLQHGSMPQDQHKSRTILGPKWLMEILLPLDINYHGAHHLNPRVPHYWLKRFSQDLKLTGPVVREESYAQALAALFSATSEKVVLTKIAYK